MGRDVPKIPFEHDLAPPLDLNDLPASIRQRALAELFRLWPVSFLLARNRTLKWTFDLCSVAVCGAGIREETEYPCEAIFPCGPWNWGPDLLAPITATPIRGLTRACEPLWKFKEVCAYHWGIGYVMGDDDLLRPVVCTSPSRQKWKRSTDDHQQGRMGMSINTGFFAVLPEDNAYDLPGDLLYGIVALDEPPWQSAMFTGDFKHCGIDR